ncbi:MAG: carbohydrate-binding family 9-like protein [bacterium]
MATYLLKQGWVQKPLENLAVKCEFTVMPRHIKAVFDVTEPSVRAVNTGFNEPVWQDSCVELFLSLDKKNYYNFEINCIGSILGQFGISRENRTFLESKTLELIKVFSTLGEKPFGIKEQVTNYRIEIFIPKEVFVFSINPELTNITGNIYKCADLSPTPHYMYLFEINSKKPDFHRPEFFKKL